MSNNAVDFTQKTFLLVTGASKGIGQMVAVQCAQRLANGSVCVLLARSSDGLEETKQKILELNPGVQVKTYPIDLSSPTDVELKSIFNDSLSGQLESAFQLAMVVHNVGSLGDLSRKAHDFGDANEWRSFFDLNVFAVATLNSCFVHQFNAVRTVVVNVTSKCASVPFNSFTLYCSSRAAREMYFKVLASESEHLVVLNYSPGVVDTAMTVDVQATSNDAKMRDNFRELRESAKMVKPIETANKMIAVLESGKFQSGDKVDYYDV